MGPDLSGKINGYIGTYTEMLDICTQVDMGNSAGDSQEVHSVTGLGVFLLR